MSDSRIKRRVDRIAWLSALLCFAIGAALFLHRTQVLGVPVLPDQTKDNWLVEAKINIESGGGRLVKARLQAPQKGGEFEILNEKFISDGFSFAILSVDGRREIVWSRRAPEGKYSLSYQAVIRRLPTPERIQSYGFPEEQETKLSARQRRLIEASYRQAIPEPNGERSEREGRRVKNLLRDIAYPTPGEMREAFGEGIVDNPGRTFKLAQRALRSLGFSNRKVRGPRVLTAKRNAPIESWLEIRINDRWLAFDLLTSEWRVPDGAFPWWRGSNEVLEVEGASSSTHVISVTPSDIGFSRFQEAEGATASNLSLYDISAESQAVYRLLLLMPLGALVIAFIRNVIGLRTIGTFMPVLIALAFRETQLLNGLLLFSAVIACGMVARFLFERMKLLVVPRLAATLTLVVVIIVGGSIALEYFGVDAGLRLALFPIVIITMTIERISIIMEELGFFKALRQTVVSLVAASIAYLVISDPILEYLMFTFPELLLVVLGLTILLGRYTGYRMNELVRFRSFEEAK